MLESLPSGAERLEAALVTSTSGTLGAFMTAINHCRPKIRDLRVNGECIELWRGTKASIAISFRAWDIQLACYRGPNKITGSDVGHALLFWNEEMQRLSSQFERSNSFWMMESYKSCWNLSFRSPLHKDGRKWRGTEFPMINDRT